MPSIKKCPVCNSVNVKFEYPKQYLYENSGLTHVVLIGGVEHSDCSDCQNKTTFVQGEQQLLQLLGLMIVIGPPGISGEELRFLRSLMGISQSLLAKRMKISRRETISEWEKRIIVFKSPADEILLKLVLLSLFKERVFKSSHCFLDEVHLGMLDKFMNEFAQKVESMLSAPVSSRKLKVKRRPRLKTWESNTVVSM